MAKKQKPNWKITCTTCKNSFYVCSEKNPIELHNNMRCPFCRVAIHEINVKKPIELHNNMRCPFCRVQYTK